MWRIHGGQRSVQHARRTLLKGWSCKQLLLLRIRYETEFDENGGHARLVRHGQLTAPKLRLTHAEIAQMRAHREGECERVGVQPKHARSTRLAIARCIGVNRNERGRVQPVGKRRASAIVETRDAADAPGVRKGPRQDDARAAVSQQPRQIFSHVQRDLRFFEAVPPDRADVEWPPFGRQRAMAGIDHEGVAPQYKRRRAHGHRP